MSVQAIDTLPAAMRPLPKPRREWGAALRAVRKLVKDKEDTTQVFEIMRALNGTSIRDCYDKMLTTLSGGRQAFERKELVERLMDDAWLDQFAPGTLGAAYRHFIRSQHLSAEGLAEVSRTTGGDIDVPHPHAWMGRRARDVHDIWHVLSGYHRDALGEACLVAFSYAQLRGLGWALIAVAAVLRSSGGDYPYARAIWQGYQRGKAASWLLAEDYEHLLGEPLEAARQRLGITPATLYNAIPAEARDAAVPQAVAA